MFCINFQKKELGMRYYILLVLLSLIFACNRTEVDVDIKTAENIEVSTIVPKVTNWRYCPEEEPENDGLCFAWNVYFNTWGKDRIEAKEGEVVYRLVLQGYLWYPLSYKQIVIKDSIAEISVSSYNQYIDNYVYNRLMFDTVFCIARNSALLDSLETIVHRSNIWDMNAGDSYRRRGADGEDYILEISRNGVNKVWVRWSPELAVERLGDYTDVKQLQQFINVTRAINEVCKLPSRRLF